jgi:hypothetical protein
MAVTLTGQFSCPELPSPELFVPAFSDLEGELPAGAAL